LRVPERAIAVGRRVRVHVHANDVTVTSASPLDSSMQNAWPGQIEAIHSDVHPATCLLVIRHRHHRWLARVTRRAQDSLSLRVGLEVWSHIKSVAFTDQGVGSVDLENP
jgi:molybdate transport system ATP-binding protein